MNQTTSDLVLLTFGAVGLLIILTLVGEVLANRRPGALIDTYKTRVNSWWAMVILFALALVMFAALYLNFKLPPAYRTRLPVLIGGVAAAVVLSLFAAISGWGLAMKWTSLWFGAG